MRKTVKEYRSYIVVSVLTVVIIFLLNILGVTERLALIGTIATESSIRTSLQQDQQVQDYVNDLLLQIADLKQLQDENEELRSLLDFEKKAELGTVVANVISRDPLNVALVTIDAGAQSGIREGHAVIVRDGILIGKILTVFAEHSVVELLTNPTSKIAVTSIDAVGTSGILQGFIGATARIEYIRSEDATLETGSTIMTSGIEPLMPAGLLVGKIAEISESSDDLFLSGTLEPLVALDALSIVAVVTNL